MKLIIYIGLCLMLIYWATGFVSQKQQDFEAMMEAKQPGAGVVECRPGYFQKC